MKRIYILLTAMVILFATSCSSNSKTVENKNETKFLSNQEAQEVAEKYLFYAKNGFELRLTKEEALKKGISSEEYDLIASRTKMADKLFKEQLEALKDGEKIYLYLDSANVDPECLTDKIEIRKRPKNVSELTQQVTEKPTK